MKSNKQLLILSLASFFFCFSNSVYGATYYSRANTAWNVASTWSTTGYTGSASTLSPTTGDIVNIGNGNTVTVSANATCASITIDASGILNPTGTATVSATTGITINGTYTNQSTGAITTPSWTCNGTYNHATSSVTLPLGLTTSIWAVNSNFNVTGSYSVATVFLNFMGQTFGNFTFNPLSMTNTVALVGATGTVTVKGNFTITQTGSNVLYMRVNGQQFASTLNIEGNFILSAGTFDLHNGGPTLTDQIINLDGNFTLSGTSILTQTTTTSGSTVGFNFTGSGIQNIIISPTAAITSQATTPTCAILFNVANGSTINMGTSVLTGTNNTSFTLNPGAGIITANTNGLSSVGTTGSIQVSGSITFSNSANYTYNGSSSQITGNGLPSTVNNLTISNSSGIALSAGETILGTLALGNNSLLNLNTFTLYANSLTIGGTTQSTGSYGGTGSGATHINTTNFTAGTGQVIAGEIPPSNLSYTTPNVFPTGSAITPLSPAVTGTVTSYSVNPALPAGLTLSTGTGVISGTPSANTASATYTVTATNSGGNTTFGVVIGIWNNRYAVNAASANWNLTSTWSTTSGGASGASVPTAGDVVFIGDAAVARAVTIPAGYTASCASLTIGNSSFGTSNSLTLNAGDAVLNVNGDITMNRPNTANTNALNVNTGTANISGSVTFTGTSGTNFINTIVITSGTLSVSGNLTFSTGTATNNVINMSGGAGTLNLAGAFNASAGTLTPGTTSTFNFNGTNQTITDVSSITYNHLILSGSGIKTLVAATTSVNNLTLTGNVTATTVANLAITGNLNIGAGATFTTGSNFTLSVTGTSNITGTLTLGGTGTKTFTGDVTLNTGCIWNETGVASINHTGSLTNNATTFTANTGVHTFSGSTKTLSGSTAIVIPRATFTGNYINSGTLTVGTLLTVTGAAISLTNNTTITATTALSGTGGLVQGTAGTLYIGGTSAITTLTATAVGNTVNYTGTGQSLKVIAYHHLTLSGGAETFGAITTVGGNFSLSGTAIATTAANLAIGGNLSIASGTTLTTGGTFTLGITGTSAITGTLALAGTGTKTFTGDVTINSGGIWNETGIAAINYSGSLQHNGSTFTALTGTHTFSGGSKTISGASAISIQNIAVTGTYTNSGNLTVTTALTGTGGLTNGNGTTGTLTITGTSTISSLTATASGNTVNYNGAAQSVFSTNYYNLTLSGSLAKTLQTGTTIINNNFTITGTANATGVIGLTIGGSVLIDVNASFTAGSFTHNVGGNWTKSGTFTSTGSTFNFNGSTASQSISSCIFNNISFAGNAPKTATGILTISGNLTINSNFTAGNFTHTVTGDFTNNGTFTSNSGTISIIGTTGKSINGTSQTSFYNLILNRSGGVTLGADIAVSGTLTLTAGMFDISNNNLSIPAGGSISGATASFYIKTSGTGRLKRNITAGGTVYVYPIGKAAYNPISISSSATGSGNSDDYSIRVEDGTITNANAVVRTVNKLWYISSSSTGVTSLNISATYNSGETQGLFNATNLPKMGYFNGSSWAYSNATYAGSNPYTFTASGTTMDMTNTNGFIALGSSTAFNASKFFVTIQPPNPYAGVNTTVITVQSQNSTNTPTNVYQDTYFDLSTNWDFSRVGGLTGMLLSANSYQTSINNVLFNFSTWNSSSKTYDASANVTATRTSGESLSAGTSTNFAILDGSIYKPSTSGNWNGVQWQKSIDGGSSWTNTSLPTDNIFGSADLIQIPIGITLTANVTTSFYSMLLFGTLDINSSGSLTINHSSGDLSDYNIKVYGTLKNSGGTITNSNPSYTPVYFYGGTYWHNMNGGSIPTATWQTLNSTLSICNITGITSSPITSGLNQNFQNFTWNNASQGSTIQNITGNITVAGALTLTNGIISTGSNRVVVNLGGSLSSANNSHINGNLRIYVPNGITPSVFFPIGDATNYTPVTVDFLGTTASSGYLDAVTTAVQPPLASGISQSKYINRRWTLQNSGVSGFTSFNPTFTFTDADKVGSPTTSALVIRKLDNNLWATTTIGTRTANTTQCTGLTSFSDFVIGEDNCTSTNYIWDGGISTDWNTAGNWCSNQVPTATVDVSIPAGPMNQPSIGSTGGICKSLTIENGANLTITGSNALIIKGNLSNSGTLTTNTSTVSFTGTSAQTISGSSTFNNLTVNNSAGVTAASDLSVNGILNLQSTNASATVGALDMSSHTLNMGINSTNTGIGDVTGLITRSHNFAINTSYSFGNTGSTLKFNAVSGTQTFPTTISVNVSIGNAISWGTTTPVNATKRQYELSYTGSPSGNHATFRISYLDSELAPGVNESMLSIWSHVPATDITTDEGWANYDVTQNYITIADIDFINLPPTLQVAIAPGSASVYTWNGSQTTDWNTSSNWTPNGVPNGSVGVIIPDNGTTTYDPNLPVGAVAQYLIIESGGVLNSLTNATLSLSGSGNVWSNEPAISSLSAGIFNPGTSTVMISNTSAYASIVGATDFYNLTVLDNAQLRISTGSYIGISGALSLSTNGVLDARTNPNTIEFKGNNPVVPVTNFTIPGYSSITLNSSVSGTFTCPATLNLSGNFRNNKAGLSLPNTLIMDGNSSQILGGSASTIFNNLTISNVAGVVDSTNITINGALTFISDNPSTNDRGALALASNIILDMGVNSTTTGPGEVSGIIRRTHAFTTSTQYSFGSQMNNLTFAAVSGYPGQTLPSSVSLKVTIGTAPDWSANSGPVISNPIKRVYGIVQTGASGTRALMQVHYRENEIPVGVSETDLTIWSSSYNAGSFVNKEVGRSNYNSDLNYVAIQDVDFALFPSVFGYFYATLAPSLAQNYTWIGAISTSWDEPTNWTPNGVPDATHGAIIPNTYSTPYAPTLPATASCKSLQINTGGVLNAAASSGIFTLTGANAAWDIQTGGIFNANTSTVEFNANATTLGDVAIGGTTNFYNLSITNGTLVRPSLQSYIGISGTLSNSGTLAAATNENVFEFNGSSTQSIPNPNGSTAGYHNLILSNSGTKNLPANLNITDEFTNNAGGTVNMGSGTVIFDGNSLYGQVISGSTLTTFYNLIIDNQSDKVTVESPIGVNNTLNITSGSVLDMGNNALSGSILATTGSGTIYTQNTGSTPVSSGKTWVVNFSYNGTAPQSIVSGTYSNLTINNVSGITATGNFTVNGVLNLQSANPSGTQGALETGGYTLNMGASSTITGIGDVTGIVKRSHTFNDNQSYSFGNQYSTLTFMGISGSVKPAWISCKIAIGNEPLWQSGSILRTYNFAQDGTGTDQVFVAMHYLDAELNGNDESKIVFWDHHSNGTVEQHGKSNNDVLNNWIGISGLTIKYLAPATTLTDKQWGFFSTTVIKNTWLAADESNPTKWDVAANWSAGHYPGYTTFTKDSVLIPTGASNYPTLTLPVEMSTIELESGASLTANSYNITMYGSRGAWINNGSFIPGSGNVIFANDTIIKTVTLSGTTNFNNIQIVGNTLIQPSTNSIMRISGTITADGTSILDFTSNKNTVEYNGVDQSITNLVGPSTNRGYHDLVISGSGTKTLPGTLNIAGDFTNNGTIDVTTNSTTVIMKDQGHVQNIGGTTNTTFYNLTVDNTDQTVTASSSFNVSNALAVNSNTTLDMTGYVLGGSPGSINGTGILKTQNTSGAPLPQGKTWTCGVIYNNPTTAQTASYGTYISLQLSNPAGITASGTLNCGSVTIDNNSTLSMSTYALTCDGALSGTGTLKTQNTSATPIPAGKTFDGLLIYNGSAAQTAVAGTFANLGIENAAGVSLSDSITVNGTVLINSGKLMTVNAGAKLNTQFLLNNAGVSGLTVKSGSKIPSGTLIFQNGSQSPVSGTVEMYSVASWTVTGGVRSNYRWQFVGIPVTTVTADPTFYGGFVRQYNESGKGSGYLATNRWMQLVNTSTLTPFTGYEIVQQTAKTYVFQGQLINSNYSQVLPRTSSSDYPGQHLLSNPYTAAIDIRQLSFGDDFDKTVYLYNTGSLAEWSAQTGSGENPGQYISSTLETAGSGGIPWQIPSMQGFLIKIINPTPTSTLFEIPYSSVITKNVTKQRTKASKSTAEKIYTRIDVAGTRYTDKMWIFTDPTCTRGFDNGWDGEKLSGSTLAPQLWAMETVGNYQIDAVGDINNTELGFTRGEDTNYKLTFTHQNLYAQYSALYLIDLQTNSVTDITQSGTQYSFTATATSPTKRFKIVTSPGISTGLDPNLNNRLKIYSFEKTIYINNATDETGDVTIYDVAGRMIEKIRYNPNSVTTTNTNLAAGSYVAKSHITGVEHSDCLIIK